jgi:hypothetical protein
LLIFDKWQTRNRVYLADWLHTRRKVRLLWRHRREAIRLTVVAGPAKPTEDGIAKGVLPAPKKPPQALDMVA